MIIRRFLPGVLIVSMALLPSSSPYIGDTMSYAADIVRHLNGERPGLFDPLWEFGHLLWRPIGAIVAPVARALVPVGWTTDTRIQVAFGLLAISIVAALATGALLYDMLRRIAGWRVAALLVFGLSWANGFLMYALSGSAYVPALFCSTAALWVLMEDPLSRRRQQLAGVLGATAGLVWFPHVLTLPALALVPWIWKKTSPAEGFRSAISVAVPAMIVLVLVYTLGALMAGVGSPSQAIAWFTEASHGWEQNQQWKRAVSGVARLMLDLSQDGVMLKRYVLGDPFQKLTFADLIRQSLWKLAAFYLFIAAVVWMCLRTPRGRQALLIALAASVPLLFFALVLLEPSSPERFLPLVPFVLLACAAGWHGIGRWVVAGFLVMLPILNGGVFIEALSAAHVRMTAQMADLRAHAAPNDLIVTVTFSDPLAQWLEQRVYHPSLHAGAPPTYQLIAAAEVTSRRWRQRFAAEAIGAWNRGSDVWIRRRALLAIPDPGLWWVEGDHPELRWKDVTAFLNELDYDSVTARPDGFTRVARSERSRMVLERVRADSLAQ